MNTVKILARQLLSLVLFLQSAALCAAATEKPIGAKSLKQLCAQALADAPEQVLEGLDGLHADKTSVDEGLHSMLPTETIKKYLNQRATQVYKAPYHSHDRIAFSPNGELMVAGFGSKLYVWRKDVSEPDILLIVNRVGGTPALFINDSQIAVTERANNDDRVSYISVWDTNEKKCIKRISNECDKLLGFNLKAKRFSVYKQGGFKVCSIDGTCEAEVPGAWGIETFNSEGTKIAAKDFNNGNLSIINIATQEVERRFDSSDVYSVAFNSEGSELAVTKGRAIRIYDLQTENQYKELSIPEDHPVGTFLSVAYAGDKVVGRFSSSYIYLFNAQTSRLERFWQGGISEAPGEFSPDGSKIATFVFNLGDAQSKLCTYDLWYEDELNAFDIEEQRLMLRAAVCFKKGEACPVDPRDPVFKRVLARFPNLRSARYFTFIESNMHDENCNVEPLPLAPVFSSDAPSAPSASISSSTASSSTPVELQSEPAFAAVVPMNELFGERSLEANGEVLLTRIEDKELPSFLLNLATENELASNEQDCIIL